MALIFIASADADSGPRGSRILTPVIRWLVPDISAEALGRTVLVARKVVHVVTYAVLAGLLWRALVGRSPGRWEARPAWLALGLTVAYAISDEFHQRFVPPRVGSPWDVVIDTVGAAVMLAGIWRIGRWRRRW